MEDFFGTLRDSWPAGRVDYHWHVLWDVEQQQRLYARYRGLTHDRPGLVPVRAAWMHMTIQQLAPQDEISQPEREQISALVRDGCARVTAFAAIIGTPRLWHHSIICPVGPQEPVRELWRVTVRAARQVLGDRSPKPPDTIHPHLTLAYAAAHVDDQPLWDWLDSHPDATAEPVRLPVTQLHLVAQQHNAREISWHRLDRVALGATGR